MSIHRLSKTASATSLLYDRAVDYLQRDRAEEKSLNGENPCISGKEKKGKEKKDRQAAKPPHAA